MNEFDLINPLDFRYYGRKKSLVEKLSPYLSESARVKYQAKVEAAVARVLAKKRICSQEIAREIEKASEKVTAEEVYREEEKIKHDIRALANVIRHKVSDKAKPFVHFCLTSYDVVDTANALRFKEATEKVVLPELKALEKTLIKLALRERKTLQIGRTHGQHAEPITFGFALASYVSRLGSRIKVIENAKDNMVGKISGAVGAYNSSSLFLKNPREFERLVLKELGLKPSLSSTQIVEPEPLTDLIHALISAFGVLANFADDMRHLQRTEINEVMEAFGEKQVGSSTMPQKRNPINFENIKSFWKEFMPRMNTVYLDQISEHQRDLTNSASQRFLPEVFVALYLSALRLNAVCKKLKVDKDKMNRNFFASKGMILAEPLYLLLAFYGHSNAHEHVRKLTLQAEKEGKPLRQLALEDESLKPFLKKFTERQKSIAFHPEKYTGIAAVKTKLICSYWQRELKLGK